MVDRTGLSGILRLQAVMDGLVMIRRVERTPVENLSLAPQPALSVPKILTPTTPFVSTSHRCPAQDPRLPSCYY